MKKKGRPSHQEEDCTGAQDEKAGDHRNSQAG